MYMIQLPPLPLRDSPYTVPRVDLSNDPSPKIHVSGIEALATVELYSDSSCTINAGSPTPALPGQSSVVVEAGAINTDGSCHLLRSPNR